jgi:hypothetical protein
VAGEQLFARVTLDVEPLADPERAAEVANGWRRGDPAAFLPRRSTAMRNAADGGGLYGYPVTGIAARLDAHASTSGQPEIALNSAASHAFATRSRRGPVVLEPYGGSRSRPEDYRRAVMKTLQQRRAVVSDTGYVAKRRRSSRRGADRRDVRLPDEPALHTPGRGSFSLEPLDYRPLPDNLDAAPPRPL